jgi:hypothetical protein
VTECVCCVVCIYLILKWVANNLLAVGNAVGACRTDEMCSQARQVATVSP